MCGNSFLRLLPTFKPRESGVVICKKSLRPYHNINDNENEKIPVFGGCGQPVQRRPCSLGDFNLLIFGAGRSKTES